VNECPFARNLGKNAEVFQWALIGKFDFFTSSEVVRRCLRVA
jgi:hypothetical protein